jgi:transcriptional regulator with PAS, ATPase and Fis domain
MRTVREDAALVAAGPAKVLITGESGVGKDLVGRYIHARSARADRPFVAINCAGLSETLLEAELFGHVKGSFTGAHRDKIGIFQLGHRGTVFLDEVGEMSMRMQALLLRFLESGEVRPVGSESIAQTVDVRIISATNRSLYEMVQRREFREDLMYRLTVVHLKVPPLRERREDILALIDHIVTRHGRTLTLSEDARRRLQEYDWPGNVRELQNVIEQLVWMRAGKVIEAADLPSTIGSMPKASTSHAAERRRLPADEIFEALVSRSCTFWEHVYPLFINRDITRHDLAGLIRRGLAVTSGNYRALLSLFGISQSDYKRFLNFLSTHACTVDFRQYRSGKPPAEPVAPPLRVHMLKSSGDGATVPSYAEAIAQ